MFFGKKNGTKYVREKLKAPFEQYESFIDGSQVVNDVAENTVTSAVVMQ